MSDRVSGGARRGKADCAGQATRLEDIPNIGASIASDLRALGITSPAQLIGRDPYELYRISNEHRGVRQDPCLADTFIAAVRFMQGAPRTPWWHYTAERKRHFGRP